MDSDFNLLDYKYNGLQSLRDQHGPRKPGRDYLKHTVGRIFLESITVRMDQFYSI